MSGRLTWLAVALGVALAASAVSATTPPPLAGADAPGFEQALDAWLGDDESTALAALADLAIGGNPAARVLLGLIDKSPSLQGPYLAYLPRATRIALLRAPGGMSGRSWLSQVDAPLVEAWNRLHQVGAGPEMIDTFTALGEPRAAREALVVLALRAHPGLRQIDPETVDPDTLYLLWHSGNGDRQDRIAALTPPTHPQRPLLGDGAPAPDPLEWLTTSANAAPLTALCAARCPEARDTCLGAAYQALGSLEALLTLGTPSESLVDQATFLASPRGQASVMRRILLGTPMRGRRSMIARVTAQSECLGSALIAENERYRLSRPAAVNGD